MGKSPTKDEETGGSVDTTLEASEEETGKTDEELFAELEQEEAAALAGGSPPAGDLAGDEDFSGAAADDGSSAKDDSEEAGAQAASGDEEEPAAAEAADTDIADGSQSDQEVDWNKADPALKAAHEALQSDWEQRDRRLRTQLSALNRRLREERQQREQLQSQAQPATASDDSGDDDEELKALMDEYPEVAAPLLKKISRLERQIADTGKTVTAIADDRHDSELVEQETALEEEIPDWRDLAALPEFGVVPDENGKPVIAPGTWLDSQPRHIQKAALSNATVIEDAAEAADVIGRFKAFRSEQGETSTPDPETPNANNGQGNGKQPLSGRRKRQLDSSASAQGKGPGVGPGGVPRDGDPEETWDAWEREEQRQAG